MFFYKKKYKKIEKEYTDLLKKIEELRDRERASVSFLKSEDGYDCTASLEGAEGAVKILSELNRFINKQ
jgi:hypothetical protein